MSGTQSGLFKIPLQPNAQVFNLNMNGIEYIFTFRYYDIVSIGGWFFDIDDASGNSIVAGQALAMGTDLLANFATLGIGGQGTAMFAISNGADPYAPPNYDDLGVNTQLYYYVPVATT